MSFHYFLRKKMHKNQMSKYVFLNGLLIGYETLFFQHMYMPRTM